jgi:large conductance mechanosensitive channel
MAYGAFINAVINFLIVAFAILLMIKRINKLRRKQEQAPEKTPVPPRRETLLEEIRDILRALAERLAAPSGPTGGSVT